METLMRNILLFLAKNKLATKLAQSYGLQAGASRFVAGDTISSAVDKVRDLNKHNILATLDHLGEFVGNEDEAIQSADYCIKTLDAIQNEGVKSGLSVKLTQLGLDISRELCIDNMHRILDRARTYHNFVRIDMEDYAHNEVTLDIFKRLHQHYPETVGLVIQAYLYKSEKDLEDLTALHPNLRIVKGAYKESAQVAFPAKPDVDTNFVHLLQKHLMNGNYTAIATHDLHVIDRLKQFVRDRDIPTSQFEFQMLYGIRPQLQEQLADEGYTVRVYVPYGTDWYGYFMRRLAERPANVGFVLKSMWKK
ncbi:proline dehydrogenase family protein [Alicyclobacillus tolerans]|uniref:proline dehydrogenase family protein n=1 Tax=Alicyclobacillus tolerans TaxID=90970 RepID=UPI001F35A682|nr:proline dehydrogenase family protein [Alicyclobacillus tolerans]MCF8564715.1 proline dehydrogenase family protein [Alicyclobacillus tolerans]